MTLDGDRSGQTEVRESGSVIGAGSGLNALDLLMQGQPKQSRAEVQTASNYYGSGDSSYISTDALGDGKPQDRPAPPNKAVPQERPVAPAQDKAPRDLPQTKEAPQERPVAPAQDKAPRDLPPTKEAPQERPVSPDPSRAPREVPPGALPGMRIEFPQLTPENHKALVIDALLTRPDAPRPSQRLDVTQLNSKDSKEPVARALELMQLAEEALGHVSRKLPTALSEQVIIAKDGTDFKRFKVDEVFTRAIEAAEKLTPEDFQRRRSEYVKSLCADMPIKTASGAPQLGSDGKPVVMKAWGNPDDPKNEKESTFQSLKSKLQASYDGLTPQAKELAAFSEIANRYAGNEQALCERIRGDAGLQPELAKLINDFKDDSKGPKKISSADFQASIKKLVESEPALKSLTEDSARFTDFYAKHPEVAIREQYEQIKKTLEMLEDGKALLSAQRLHAAALQSTNNPDDIRRGIQIEKAVDRAEKERSEKKDKKGK